MSVLPSGVDGPREIALLRPELRRHRGARRAGTGRCRRGRAVATRLLVPEALGDLGASRIGRCSESRSRCPRRCRRRSSAGRRRPASRSRRSRRRRALVLSQYGVSAGIRPSRDGREAEVGKIAERRRKPVAAMAASASMTISPGRVVPWCAHAVAAALRPLDPLDGGVEGERAAAPGSRPRAARSSARGRGRARGRRSAPDAARRGRSDAPTAPARRRSRSRSCACR